MTENKLILFIFDLDYTLHSRGILFKQIPTLLNLLYKNGIFMAMASFNYNAKPIARQLGISEYFDIIIGGLQNDILSKSEHVFKILDFYRANNILFDRIYFFDDMKEVIESTRRSYPNIRFIKVDPTIGALL